MFVDEYDVLDKFVMIRDVFVIVDFVFCQAEDGIRDLVRSRGLGDVYKRQTTCSMTSTWSKSGNASPTGYTAATIWPCNKR